MEEKEKEATRATTSSGTQEEGVTTEAGTIGEERTKEKERKEERTKERQRKEESKEAGRTQKESRTKETRKVKEKEQAPIHMRGNSAIFARSMVTLQQTAGGRFLMFQKSKQVRRRKLPPEAWDPFPSMWTRAISHMLFAVTDMISGIRDDSEDVYMLIDSGACENVARKGEFEDDFKPLPHGKRLFSVQGTALKIYGKQFPKIRLLDGTVGEVDLTVTDASETLLSVHNLVERDYDVMFRRSGSYLVKDGKKYPLIKKGKRWYLKVGKVWPDEVGDTAQRVAALEGATSSSSSRTPVSEKKQKDYWRVERDLVIRVHVVPRLKMFSPTDADDCPAIVGDLEPSRATEAKWVDRRDGEGESFEDIWFGVRNPRVSLGKYWTGETVFKLKAQGERDAEPMALDDSPDGEGEDAQDDEDLTLWELKEREEAKQQPLMAEPVEPSPAEIAEHSLHHANFEPWCKVCVEGQGRERAHRRRHEDPKEHITSIVTTCTSQPKGSRRTRRRLKRARTLRS